MASLEHGTPERGTSIGLVTRLASLTSSLLLSACLGVTVGDHVAASGYDRDLHRIFIIDGFDETFSHEAAAAFSLQLSNELQGCGIEAYTYRPGGMVLDAEAKAKAAVVAFHPDGVLTVLERQRDVYGGDTRGGIYLVRLSDVVDKHEIWRGDIKVITSARLFSDRSPIGRQLATTIVRQLATDSVLKHCPPPSPDT